MNTVIWILLLAGLAVTTAILTANGGAFVLIVLPPWRIELSVAAFVIAVLLMMVLGFFVTRVTAGTLSLPFSIRALRLGRRQAKAKEAVLFAVEAFFEGNYARAEQAAQRALTQGESVGLCAVIAARAAHHQRRFTERDQYLESLHSLLPRDRVLQLSTQADLLLDERRHQEATEVLRRAREIAPRSQTVRRLTLRAQVLMRQWDLVLKTLQTLEAAKGIDDPHAEAVRRQALLGLLARHGQDTKSLRTFWRSLSQRERSDRALVISAASLFIGLKLMDDARTILEQSLDDVWDTEFAALYGKCHSSSVLEQIKKAENWLTKHPQDAGLLLSLGRLCLHQSLWGKAQNYLEASLALEPSREGRALLDEMGTNLISRMPKMRPMPPELEGG
jgi:HemY protein